MEGTILVIEDDADIADLIRYSLEREGFRVRTAGDGRAGLERASSQKPDLVVLDLMLPDLSGMEICRYLKERAETRQIPIVMVTAKTQKRDIVLGLNAGADDYITKPFSTRELIARVRAVLRRSPPAGETTREEQTQAGPLVINSSRHEVLLHGKKIFLTLAEFRLVAALAARPGHVFTREQLLSKMTGDFSAIIDRNVDVHIRSIRRKFGDERDLIETVRGVGYKWRS